MRPRLLLAAAAVAVLAGAAIPANAFHFYRDTGSGCAPNDGALTDDPLDQNGDPIHGPLGASVQVLHNGYKQEGVEMALFGFRVLKSTVTIAAGDSVTWTWNSAHCHSVTFDPNTAFGGTPPDSGFFYPTTAPNSPRVVPGFFEYPKPTKKPTLSWTHTFSAPGTYTYFCVHHVSIGMSGTVVVQ